ncbi:exonuclease domain-containing protein [Rhizobium sp. Root482]|uniref:exonuclease domain-containing protein n=1 Tax=Rhizobium sp. Root482 TaxID=1736543 RepID=UPI0006F60410|nr:exonuclease domain-containing protein [Rhizobium sp. Root482]KQY12629.1 hypothetical protein ASD31_15475 [Rhizobium sp. Root482]
MDYIVLDVETANPNYASICQVGLIDVRGGHVVDTQSILINPEDFFDPFNISIHGITEERVRGAPTFRDVHADLLSRLGQRVAIHHGPFDRVAFTRASDKYGLQPLLPIWLDNQSVVRRTWPDFARSGYGLKNLCRHFDFAFSHHDALEDARVTELIFRRALAESGTTLPDWLVRSKLPISAATVGQAGNPQGRFHGQTIVFTGDMGVPRSEAAGIAAKLGFDVLESVNKKVTLLVVGLQDLSRLAGYEKSSKQRKAETLREAGHDIEIVSDSDFWAMIPSSMRPPQRPVRQAQTARGTKHLAVEISLESLFSDAELEEMFGVLLNDELG